MDPQPAAPQTNPTPPAPVAPPAPAAEASLPSVPATWPGAFGIYKYSKQAVKYNLSTVVTLVVGSTIINLVLHLLLKDIGVFIGYLISIMVSIATTLVYIAGVRKQKLSLGQALSDGLPLILKVIGVAILVGLSIGLSLVLLIIPFFFVLPRLMLVNYFLIDKKLGVIDSYKASWEATKGHSLKVWGILGVNVLIGILVITIIGIPFSIYWWIMYGAAFAVLYESINTQTPATPAASPAMPVSPGDIASTPPAPDQPSTPPTSPTQPLVQ
jgi:hypothetical protein